jgi:hypothetical protein
MPKLVLHTIDLGGGVKRLVRLPDFYGGGTGVTGSTPPATGAVGIGSSVGIEKATSDDLELDILTVNQLVSTGKAAYLTIRHGSNADMRSSKVLCSKDKLDTAAQTILDKIYRARTVQSAGFSRRRRRG